MNHACLLLEMMRVSAGCLTEGAKQSWRDQPVQVRPG
jgi:hypothetical protein